MPRYIDADEIFYDQLLNTGRKEHPLEFAVSKKRIDDMPIADVANVVRCWDCKHLSSDRIAPEWNRICRKYGVGKSDYGFCDEVERKDTEDV